MATVTYFTIRESDLDTLLNVAHSWAHTFCFGHIDYDGINITQVLELITSIQDLRAGEPLLIEPNEVNIMSLDAETIRLTKDYLRKVHDEEYPREASERLGMTPVELGARRRTAHNKLIEHLSRQGVNTADRAAITELAYRVDRWCEGE